LACFARAANSPPVQIAITRQPVFHAASNASSVSSVFPECEEQMTSVPSPRAKAGKP